MVTADDEQPTNEVELPGRPVASAAGAEDTMVDVPRDMPLRDESVTAPLGRRSQPDVLFTPAPAAYQAPPSYQAPPPYQGQAPQPAFGPDDATGPQAPLAAQGYGAFPSAAPQGPPRKKRGPAPLIALVSVLGIIVLAAAAFFLWPAGDEKTIAQNASAPPRVATATPTPTASVSAGTSQPGTSPSTSAAPPSAATPATPATPSGPALPQAPAPVPQPNQTGVPVSGTTSTGVGVTYQTVEVSPGYFEGTLTFTNNTSQPMPSWTVSFNYPGSNITNVWGGVLVQTGSQVTIRSDATSAPVPVGSSVSVRFGGSGTPSQPATCLLAGQPCGF